MYIIEDDQTGRYISNDFKSLTDKESHADQYDSLELATKALIKSRVKASVNILKVSVQTQHESVCEMDAIDIVIQRRSHLDATHVGQSGNPYFYYCDEVEGKDYTYNMEKHLWELCDWCLYEDDEDKTHSQANTLIRINFEQ